MAAIPHANAEQPTTNKTSRAEQREAMPERRKNVVESENKPTESVNVQISAEAIEKLIIEGERRDEIRRAESE